LRPETGGSKTRNEVKMAPPETKHDRINAAKPLNLRVQIRDTKYGLNL
jgi:hypothetical protein